MKVRAALPALLLTLFVSLWAHAGEVLDRIIVVVNNTPVLLSDWDEALRCEALLAARTPESFSNTEQKAVFDRLVDQQLLREQMRGYLVTPLSDVSVQDRVHETRKQLSGDVDDAHWREVLARSGVSEEEFVDRVRSQMEMERFVEARFRPGMKIDDRAVAKYYRDEFLPELKKAGQKDIPLADVSDKIREILLQQRMDEMLTSWLQTLREQAEIRVPSPKTAATATEVNPAK
jgi:hypothetical protein